MILVVCALAEELSDFETPANVRILPTGVGPVEAAIATARALARGSFACVINAGIAGVFRTRGSVGDAAIVRAETLADFGLEGGGALSLPGGARLVQRVDANPRILERCAQLGLRSARGLTVTQVTSTDTTADRLVAHYDVDVESMEGFAVLRAAADAGIPAVEVRGISNIVGDRARGEWDFSAGARATARGLSAVISALNVEEYR